MKGVNTMKDTQIKEALERMEMLGLSSQCISAFKKGKVWESEGMGALYEVNEREQGFIDKFQKDHKGCLVYHMIHNFFEFGEVYSMFYVSNDIEEWEQDRLDIKEGYPFVYAYNVDEPMFSDFGGIAVQKSIGGLKRIG